jgi:hypothetical protein
MMVGPLVDNQIYLTIGEITRTQDMTVLVELDMVTRTVVIGGIVIVLTDHGRESFQRDLRLMTIIVAQLLEMLALHHERTIGLIELVEADYLMLNRLNREVKVIEAPEMRPRLVREYKYILIEPNRSMSNQIELDCWKALVHVMRGMIGAHVRPEHLRHCEPKIQHLLVEIDSLRTIEDLAMPSSPMVLVTSAREEAGPWI